MKPLHQSTRALRAFLAQSPPPPEESALALASAPKLTVITPSYNQADYLERTILSVLNQNYPNLEYIIMDGGSQDGSVDIIKKYEKYLAYWESEKDRGQVHALNKALARATGEWISFQNSDDVYFPGTFERFGKVEKEKYDILYGHLYLITTDDEVTELLKTLPFSLTAQLAEGMQIHNQSLFFRRSLVEQYGYFDESYRFAFDYEFITRYASQPSTRIRRIEGLAGALRVHEAAKSSTIASVGLSEHERVKELYNFTKSSVRSEKMRYLWCRFRKLFYLLVDMDFSYLAHRLSQ
ncbi:glycosyltransferase family 2 protein [Rhabdobacter roseus]|uniref:Glycosyltransferase involved in cell wall biosynthesis n=1 Tax=Rhabdobacter roseus TaxID=1655419 RepID=A0A840TJ64_9BACT|nr:glycosyltransferase family 2 protein [Rhabdobacter roseus]MBB5283484.1 glycosyltransferase involved in cell wall biosynthesis [Rhabdobacter roseus]